MMPKLLRRGNSAERPGGPTRSKKLILDILSWLALAGMAYYVYRTVSPSVDLSNPLGPAPNFTLADLEGHPFTLSEHRGKVVVLNFWATWCPPCRAEIPGFINLQREFEDEDVLFVGIALDEEGFDAVAPYAYERGINYPVVLGDRMTSDRYGGITTVPTTFILDHNHTIRYRHEGLILEHALRDVLKRLADEPASAATAISIPGPPARHPIP